MTASWGRAFLRLATLSATNCRLANAWIKQQQDKQPHHRGDLVGPRRSNQKAGLMKDALIASLKAQNHNPDPPA
jgi:hypothetical protein